MEVRKSINKKKVLSCSLLCIFNRTLISPNLVFKFQSNESRKERKNEWMKQNKPNQSAAASKSPLNFQKEKKKCCQIYLKQCCFFIIHCFLPSASPLPSPPFRFACKWHTFYFFKVHQPLVAYTALKLCSFTSGCCKKNYVVIDRGLELF